MSGQVLRHSSEARQLDALVWHHPDLPEHVTVHRATTAQLQTLGWIDPTDDDQTGAADFLSRVVAQRLGAHRSEAVLYPAVGHSIPTLARPASAELLSSAPTGSVSSARLWTSLSRCAPFVIVATAQRPVGIDIEVLQTPQQSAELLAILHPGDQRVLDALTEAELGHEVTAAWTRKEAMLKAWGTGLLRDPALDVVGTQRHPAQPAGWSSLSTRFDTALEQYYLGLAWRITF